MHFKTTTLFLKHGKTAVLSVPIGIFIQRTYGNVTGLYFTVSNVLYIFGRPVWGVLAGVVSSQTISKRSFDVSVPATKVGYMYVEYSTIDYFGVSGTVGVGYND